MLAFLITLTREEEIGPRSGRAGPSFSARPEKEVKGAVLHGTSAAERSRHVKTRSANLPKLDDSHRLKHMGRFVFALRAKIPSRATQLVKRYAASAFRKLLKRTVSGRQRKVSATFRNPKDIAPQSGNDRPRQHCAKLGTWLVREFPRAAGKRKGFLFEPP